MVDENLHAWLLEVNVSPDLSHSTNITADLVPRATRDTLNCKLIRDQHIVSFVTHLFVLIVCLVVLDGTHAENNDWELLS